ncbi:MAG TPA: DUF1816 domain-containing protein [Crinalium sp.]|jgi:hypothetical protein
MNEIWANLLNTVGMAWWVEIVTETPRCTYYFGPFASSQEAKTAQGGYIEDLEQENAQGIKVVVKRCKPSNLTIFDEVADIAPRGIAPVFSGQM